MLVAPAVLAALKAGLVGAARAASPERSRCRTACPREEARERLFAHGHPAVFERALDELSAAGRIVARDRLALATHRVALSPEEARARDAIEAIYLRRRPDAARRGVGGVGGRARRPAVVDRMVKLLLRQRVLVKLDTLVFHDAGADSG